MIESSSSRILPPPLQPPVTAAERRSWALADLVDAVRRCVQHPNDPAFRAAMVGRLRDLDRAELAVAEAERPRRGNKSARAAVPARAEAGAPVQVADRFDGVTQGTDRAQ